MKSFVCLCAIIIASQASADNYVREAVPYCSIMETGAKTAFLNRATNTPMTIALQEMRSRIKSPTLVDLYIPIYVRAYSYPVISNGVDAVAFADEFAGSEMARCMESYIEDPEFRDRLHRGLNE